jgi:hypothetical protein
MDFALATVTIVSLTMTITMAVVTWRLLREERRRSAARLAALTKDLERSRPMSTAAPVEPFVPRTPAAGAGSPVVPRQAPVRPAFVDLPMRSAVSGQADAIRPAGHLFVPAQEPSGWARLVSAMAGAALVLTVAVLGVLLLNRHSAETTAGPSSPVQPLPVELLDLGHERTGDNIAIRGTIRNPAASATAGDLSVVAMAFDGDGAQVATGRSPLEHATLPPGEASSFSVSIPAHDVSRYRISFLTAGATLPHVDRRAGPLARSEAATEGPGGRP